MFTREILGSIVCNQHNINNDVVTQSTTVNPFLPSPQLTLPEDAKPRWGHTATAFSLGPGRTQVTMFGGCPKWEMGKSDDTQSKLSETTVLDFGELNIL